MAGQGPAAGLADRKEEHPEWLRQVYRHVHRYPELSTNEVGTADRIEQ